MYKVESMKEINQILPNGYNVVSTFSGCGGSCLGLKMAGFKILWANEFIPAAQDTYRANHPDTYLDTRDIRKVSATSILDQIGLEKGELDVFEGSPPCASFSMCGKRDAGWGDVKKYSDGAQRCDDLFYEYIRLLKELQPKVFIAENVKGLVQGKAKGYFIDIIKQLKECGYNVSAKVLNAKWLGVPQSRERVIFVGVRNDLGLPPTHPKPNGTLISINEAWANINRKIEEETDCKKYTIYKLWFEIKGFGSHPLHFGLIKPDPRFPSPTIVQKNSGGCYQLMHPHAPRLLSISELKRLSSFPDDFKLTGSFAQQWERVGRAVPPLMMKAIAETIRDEILVKT